MSGAAPGHRALFLDRDGIINVEKNYVHRIEEFEFMEGIFDLCRTASALGFRLVVITNQAGIGRGYYSEADFQRLTNWMLERFEEQGIGIEAVYHCPYHPTAGIGEYRRDSFDRKPNPGMILKAAAAHGLELPRSILVGDKESDIQAGEAAGVGCNIWLNGSGAAATANRMAAGSLKEIENWLKKSEEKNRDPEHGH